MNLLGTGLQSGGGLKGDSWEEMEKLSRGRDSEGGDKRLKNGSGKCWKVFGCLGKELGRGNSRKALKEDKLEELKEIEVKRASLEENSCFTFN